MSFAQDEKRLQKAIRRNHTSINRHFGPSAQIMGQGAGLHIVLTLRNTNFTENELVRHAQEKGIRILSLADAYMRHRAGYPQFMLGFGGMQSDGY